MTRWLLGLSLLAAGCVEPGYFLRAGWSEARLLLGRRPIAEMLARPDLTLSDRVLLLERAGSVYVRAARSYADATANKKPIIWF